MLTQTCGYKHIYPDSHTHMYTYIFIFIYVDVSIFMYISIYINTYIKYKRGMYVYIYMMCLYVYIDIWLELWRTHVCICGLALGEAKRQAGQDRRSTSEPCMCVGSLCGCMKVHIANVYVSAHRMV